MLGAGQEADVDVTWEDQQMINAFGRLTNKRQDIDADLKELKQTIENLEEAKTELILADGDVLYKLAETFVTLPKDDVEKLMEEDLEKLQQRQQRLQSQREEIASTLAEHKVKLYAKFKNQINLEE